MANELKDEIEITPEMRRAGAEALYGFNLDFESEEEAAVRVFLAMCEMMGSRI